MSDMNPVIRWFHQLGSPPYFDRFAARWAPWGHGLGAVVMAWGVYGALFQVPADYQQGDSFRILYIHVPAAWMSLLVFGLMALYSAIALIWRIKLCEILAMACAPIGAAFTFVTLATGSIWGKPMWGTWWVWDARLTSELILLFLYIGIIALWAAIDDVKRGDRAGSLLTLIGAINIPIIYFSVVWWNTLHQGASISLTKAPSMAAIMLQGMLVMAVAAWFYTIAVALVRVRRIILERERHTEWAKAILEGDQ